MNRTTRIIPTLSVASALGAALFAAPAHAGVNLPWIDNSLSATVSGNTVSVSYSDEGQQFALDDGREWVSSESMGYEIDYGDGSTPAGSNGGGGAICKKAGTLHPFKGGAEKGLTHTYAKPGTYTISAKSYYCGTKGNDVSATKTYKVTVGSNGSTTPSKPAPAKPSAAAHIRYTVKGNTATLTPYLTGSQYRFVMEGKEVDNSLPENYSVTIPKDAVAGGEGNWAADGPTATCTNKGSVPLSSDPLSGKPLTVTFPGPGTYPVTLNADVCTSQGKVSKTVNITIPAAGSTGSNGSTTGSAPAEATPDGTTPEGGTSAPAPAASKGPHVDTDREAGGSNDALWGAAGLAGVAALGGAGIFARRRMN